MKIILKIIKDKRGFIGTAGAMIGSALIGGAASAGSTAASIKAAKEAQEMQIKWERERAQNAHQWEVADLKAAGLNPILSAGGSGAQTGGISAPVPDTSGIAKIGDNINNAINTAANVKKTQQDVETGKNTAENIKADTLNKAEQAKNIQADTILKMSQSGLISQQEAKTKLEQQEMRYKIMFAPEILEGQRQLNYAQSAEANARAQLNHDTRIKIQAEIDKLKEEAKILSKQKNLPSNNQAMAELKYYIDLLKGWL